jgi:hypothetical protein
MPPAVKLGENKIYRDSNGCPGALMACAGDAAFAFICLDVIAPFSQFYGFAKTESHASRP